MNKQKKRNKTITLNTSEKLNLEKKLIRLDKKVSDCEIIDKIINQNIFEILNFLPDNFVDLLFVDPPYNLNKNFNSLKFEKMEEKNYYNWIDSWLGKIIKVLKPTSSIYICSEWQTSPILYDVLKKYFIVRNRITFEREKGRGARTNWKNNCEDIYFCTVSNKYTFNIDKVKIKRKVIAPYKQDGKPKDWFSENNEKFRLTYPSNIWTDITIPFWSMKENTPHPTQKPEKLLARIILASSNVGDIVFDPFVGSGTTAVVAKKLNRKFVAVDIEKDYCLYALKRLESAEIDRRIQGYEEGVFYERNSHKTVQK